MCLQDFENWLDSLTLDQYNAVVELLEKIQCIPVFNSFPTATVKIIESCCKEKLEAILESISLTE